MAVKLSGRDIYFAPDRRTKVELVDHWTSQLADTGFIWCDTQEWLIEQCCLMDNDEVDSGLLLHLQDEAAMR